jgi:dTMP kinase
LLFYAARREHVTRLIAPALDRGTWVVCDRFADSTIAYQGYGRGLPLAELQALQRFALGDFAPDLTLILDFPAAEGLARAARRSGNADRFERLDHAFHERLRQGFQQIAATDPRRCIMIDASGDVESVHRAVLGAVGARLGVALSA